MKISFFCVFQTPLAPPIKGVSSVEKNVFKKVQLVTISFIKLDFFVSFLSRSPFEGNKKWPSCVENDIAGYWSMKILKSSHRWWYLLVVMNAIPRLVLGTSEGQFKWYCDKEKEGIMPHSETEPLELKVNSISYSKLNPWK